jgi:hypothetical protein
MSFCLSPFTASKGLVVRDSYGVLGEKPAKFGEIGDRERWMGLFCGAKIGFGADMDLLIAALKPAAAAGAEQSWLFDFSQAESRAIKLASRGLAALWRSQLDVVDASYHRVPPD